MEKESRMSMVQLKLPGFRFHPTEEELLTFYLEKIAMGKARSFDIIGVLNIYHHEPWDLPGMAKIGEREWYFFVPRDRRHGAGGRPSRTTENGFWKATGSDRPIRCLKDPKIVLGIKKTLVFYTGRAPRGCRTDWVMNEYRLPDKTSFPKEDIVLCKIYRKATSMKVLEQRAAIMEQTRMTHSIPSSPPSHNTPCSYNAQVNYGPPNPNFVPNFGEEEEHENKVTPSSLGFGYAKENLKELEVPMDLTVDPLWNQIVSPWLDNWSPINANVLNF